MASVRGRAPSMALFRVLAALALLGFAALARGPQTLHFGLAANVGVLNGIREAESAFDGGVILGGVTVLDLSAVPASRSRLTLEIEAAREREVTVACPDGALQRLSLPAGVRSTATCSWPGERGGHVEIRRSAGQGRVIARSATFEPEGFRLSFDHARWLAALAILAWWLAGMSGSNRARDAVIYFLVGAAAAVIASRAEVLGALSHIGYLLLVIQASRSAMARAGHWSAGVAAIAVLAKLAFAMGGYSGGDTAFHANRLSEFSHGQVHTRSVAPGLETPLPVPYPSGVYRLLSPLGFMVDDGRGPQVIGVALWAGEALSVFLTFAISRKAGLSHGHSWTAAAMYAILPEGVMVMFKGILANVFGQTAALLVVLSLVPPVSRIGLSLSMTLVFLTHLGVTLNLLLFLAVWAWFALPAERRVLGQCFAPAALAAWVLYYQGAFIVALDAVEQVSRNLLRPATVVAQAPLIRAAKIAQNLFLKLGGLPLLALGRRGLWSEESNRLFKAMFATYLIAAALAIASPVTLRFELFAAPVFCIFAARVLDDPRAKRTVAMVAALSVTLFVLLSTRRFDIINVILESPRWPLLRDLTAL